MHSSSECTGKDFSAVKHQSHQPISSIFSSEARDEFFRFLQKSMKFELTSIVISVPPLRNPALLSVVRVVDGQFTGFITKEEDFHLQSTLVQASLLLKHQPAGRLKERDL